jgi:glycosyltransferase involved in cell wall biosynthesis
MKNKKLKIAIVSDAIYPYNKGGKEKRIFEISSRLVKAGHDVHIYCMKWWQEKSSHRIENGVKLHAISPLYPLYSGQRRSIKQALLFALACFKLMKEDFDVIEVDHMPHFLLFSTKLVALVKRKKLYATWNEVWGREYWIEYMGKLGNIAYLIEWLSSRMPDKIIAVSEHTKNKLINNLKINTEIFVIPNGINLQEIKSAKPAKQKSDVIFAGRLLSHKNVDFLIDSINLLKDTYPNIKCVIVGKGPEEENLKKLVAKLKIESNIIFYDFLADHKDLYGLMKSSRVFAFPSTREGFGIVALEANASGIPVITTNHQNNATKDLIMNGKNGHSVKLDEKKIAEKIIQYLSTEKSSNEYTQIAKDYDWNKLAKRVEEVYIR